MRGGWNLSLLIQFYHYCYRNCFVKSISNHGIGSLSFMFDSFWFDHCFLHAFNGSFISTSSIASFHCRSLLLLASNVSWCSWFHEATMLFVFTSCCDRLFYCDCLIFYGLFIRMTLYHSFYIQKSTPLHVWFLLGQSRLLLTLLCCLSCANVLCLWCSVQQNLHLHLVYDLIRCISNMKSDSEDNVSVLLRAVCQLILVDSSYLYSLSQHGFVSLLLCVLQQLSSINESITTHLVSLVYHYFFFYCRHGLFFSLIQSSLLWSLRIILSMLPGIQVFGRRLILNVLLLIMRTWYHSSLPLLSPPSLSIPFQSSLFFTVHFIL